MYQFACLTFGEALMSIELSTSYHLVTIMNASSKTSSRPPVLPWLVLLFLSALVAANPTFHRNHAPRRPLNQAALRLNQTVPDKVYEQQCEWFQEQEIPFCDVNTADLYAAINHGDHAPPPLADFALKKPEKLQVIIVPHSHNDPGWQKPIESYFEQDTKAILDTIVQALSENVGRKFIWAETSFLSLWWEQADERMRAAMRRLIVETRQLEIVTGGWVMTDEADTHYFAMIEQMLEGHEWLRSRVDASVAPRNAWAIDPFGYSPTMAYLLKQMGFDAMVITRVHYLLREQMIASRRMEFNWRQSWSTPSSKSTDIFCHVMPAKGYTVSETCGPNEQVCCQFDFLRLSNSFNCPDSSPVAIVPITDANVHERAALLLDQYRRKSQVFQHNVLLVPLGADFRYRNLREAHDQFENYERLMSYMNSRPEWNVEARFGTLDDYFSRAIPSMAARTEALEGDFFTYADKELEYWSGYFTSRPYHKRLGRVAESQLRSAEILFSFANLMQSLAQERTDAGVGQLLSIARQNMSLFQHHDGITGTSKAYVVRNFERKLRESLDRSRTVIEHSAAVLFGPQAREPAYFRLDDPRADQAVPIELGDVDDEQRVVVFNPNLNARNEIVSLRVNTASVLVSDSEGNRVQPVQVSLIWSNGSDGRLQTAQWFGGEMPKKRPLSLDERYFEVAFPVSLAGLSTRTFVVKRVRTTRSVVFSKSQFYVPDLDRTDLHRTSLLKRVDLPSAIKSGLIEVKQAGRRSYDLEVNVGNGFTAIVSFANGLLKEIETPSGERIKVKVNFKKYETDTGGAYLFMPQDAGRVLEYSKLLKWIRVEQGGPLRRRICSDLTIVTHCVEFYMPSEDDESRLPEIRIANLVDISHVYNTELSMVIDTDIQNDGLFHTDLNGFQYIERRRLDNVPIQGNVYPMPTGAFIQDERLRMNLLTGQSLGVTSLRDSSLEVFLDRNLNQDDGKGLDEGIVDNQLTPSHFVLAFEVIGSNKPARARLQQPSIYVQQLSFDLMNPAMTLLVSETSQLLPAREVSLIDTGRSAPCDLRLVSMRTMSQTPQIGIILHRLPADDCADSPVQLPRRFQAECAGSLNSTFTLSSLLGGMPAPVAQHSDLSLRPKVGEGVPVDSAIKSLIQPMQIEAFLLRLSN